MLAFGGAGAIAVMLLPGISGSLLLVICIILISTTTFIYRKKMLKSEENYKAAPGTWTPGTDYRAPAGSR